MKYIIIYEISRPHKYGKYREPFPCPMFRCRPCPSPVESYLQVSKRFFSFRLWVNLFGKNLDYKNSQT